MRLVLKLVILGFISLRQRPAERGYMPVMPEFGGSNFESPGTMDIAQISAGVGAIAGSGRKHNSG